MMKKFVGFYLFAFQLMVTAAYGDSDLLKAYAKKSPFGVLAHAFELNTFTAHEATYNEIVAWLDAALLKRGKPTILHGEQSYFQPLLEWPLYENEDGLRTYVGFIYYLGEHSKSDELKQEFLRVLATTDNSISPVLGNSSFYPLSRLAKATEYKMSRSWRQWFREVILRLRPDWRLTPNYFEAAKKLKMSQIQLHSILQQYGGYFLVEKRGLYPFTLPREDVQIALCSRLLSLTAKLGLPKK